MARSPSGIHIKKKNEGKLHRKMGVAQGKPLSTSAVEAKKAAAKRSGDTATVRQTTFALNARKWHH